MPRTAKVNLKLESDEVAALLKAVEQYDAYLKCQNRSTALYGQLADRLRSLHG